MLTSHGQTLSSDSTHLKLHFNCNVWCVSLSTCIATRPAVSPARHTNWSSERSVQTLSEGSLYFSTGMSEDYTVPLLFC